MEMAIDFQNGYFSHSFTDQGDVFGWGNSEYGQFANQTEEQQLSTPTKLTLKGVGKVIDVACGGTVCMVLNGEFNWDFSGIP